MAENKKKIPDIEKTQLSRLLNLGFLEKKRPLDRLIEGARASSGTWWLEGLIDGSPMALFGPPQELLVEGKASLGQLQTIHEKSKALKNTREREDDLRALLGYMLANAAALVHHGTLITTRTREELNPIFRDLAAALPAPWSGLLEKAIQGPE